MASNGYSIPASLLPYLTGAKKDFSSLSSSVLAVNCIFIPLVIITAALRLWVRVHMIRAVGLDDGMCAPNQDISLVLTVDLQC